MLTVSHPITNVYSCYANVWHLNHEMYNYVQGRDLQTAISSLFQATRQACDKVCAVSGNLLALQLMPEMIGYINKK